MRSTENPNSRNRTASSSGISTWAAKTRAAQGVAPAFTKRFKRRRSKHSTSAADNRSNSAAVTPDSFHAALAGHVRIGSRAARLTPPSRGSWQRRTEQRPCACARVRLAQGLSPSGLLSLADHRLRAETQWGGRCCGADRPARRGLARVGATPFPRNSYPRRRSGHRSVTTHSVGTPPLSPTE